MKILLALDDSGKAIDQAVKLASDRGASLTALFALDTGWSVYTGHDFLLGSHARGTFLDYTRDDELLQERDALEAVRKRAEETNLACHVKSVPSGHAVETILAELRDGGYDLLVMSHPFRRGLEIMRDANRQVLQRAECDVLFVRREA